MAAAEMLLILKLNSYRLILTLRRKAANLLLENPPVWFPFSQFSGGGDGRALLTLNLWFRGELFWLLWLLLLLSLLWFLLVFVEAWTGAAGSVRLDGLLGLNFWWLSGVETVWIPLSPLELDLKNWPFNNNSKAEDKCHLWSTRPAHIQVSNDHYVFYLKKVLFCMIFKSGMFKNSDHYRRWLWVGRVDQNANV